LPERNHNTFLTMIKSTHLARDAVLFDMVGLSSVVYYPWPDYTLWLLFFLILDFIGFILLWIPRKNWEQLGYVWASVMSVVLLLPAFLFLGNRYFASGCLMILLLSIVELVTVMKIAYDSLSD